MICSFVDLKNELTEGRGLVLTSCTLKMEVLSYSGCNSIMESTLRGVPIAGFPMYAEQGMKWKGESLADDDLDENKFYPLIDGASAPAPGGNSSASKYCLANSLDPAKVKGKIVACLRGITARVDKSYQVKVAGGIGVVLINPPENGNELLADRHVLPALSLGYEAGQEVYKYIKSTSNPQASILPTRTVLGVKPAPVLTAFSSQGPNTLIPDLNKHLLKLIASLISPVTIE
ncbi:hypothetical protein R1flu_004484 [Riccia fluitans]|uniref:PA domain-containing protein n=1 Tax=Riccia fluitans TaxID=41844 RepID=A0ABD1YQF1_9MARC